MSIADQMRVAGPDGPIDVRIGDIADGGDIVRDGARLRAPAPRAILVAAFTWQTDDLDLWIAYSAAACTITLPPQSDVTSWVPGTAQLRRIRKFNTSANGVILTPQANCRINGGALATAMNPIPGTAVTPSLTVVMPGALVYRASATDFYVFSG